MTNSEGGTRTPVPAGPVRSDSFFMTVVPGAVQQQWLDDLLPLPNSKATPLKELNRSWPTETRVTLDCTLQWGCLTAVQDRSNSVCGTAPPSSIMLSDDPHEVTLHNE